MSALIIYNHHMIMVGVIKSKRMGWAGYMACRKERVLVGKPREHPCIGGRIMSEDTVWEGMDWMLLGAGCREDGKESAGSTLQVCGAVHTFDKY